MAGAPSGILTQVQVSSPQASSWPSRHQAGSLQAPIRIPPGIKLTPPRHELAASRGISLHLAKSRLIPSLISPHRQGNHARSHEITRDHTRSHEVTRGHTRPHEITRDRTRSHQDHTRSPEVARDHTRSHEIARDHTRSHPSCRNELLVLMSISTGFSCARSAPVLYPDTRGAR